MHHRGTLLTVLLVAIGFGSDSPIQRNDSTVVLVDELEGTWKPVSTSNFPVGFTFWSEPLHFEAGRWNQRICGEMYSGTYRIEATHKPAYLDQSRLDAAGKEVTRMYIYKREGDILRIAWLPDQSGRPRDFDWRGFASYIVYKRVKRKLPGS